MFLHDLIRALTDAGVDYCVVGGVAVNLHGVPRPTYNVDLVVPLDMRTLRALERVLLGLGLSCREPFELSHMASRLRRRRLLRERNLFAVGYSHPTEPSREVYVVTSPPLEPELLLERAVRARLAGTELRVAALADLIFMKRVSGQLHDADDVARLESLLHEERA